MDKAKIAQIKNWILTLEAMPDEEIIRHGENTVFVLDEEFAASNPEWFARFEARSGLAHRSELARQSIRVALADQYRENQPPDKEAWDFFVGGNPKDFLQGYTPEQAIAIYLDPEWRNNFDAMYERWGDAFCGYEFGFVPNWLPEALIRYVNNHA